MALYKRYYYYYYIIVVHGDSYLEYGVIIYLMLVKMCLTAALPLSLILLMPDTLHIAAAIFLTTNHRLALWAGEGEGSSIVYV